MEKRDQHINDHLKLQNKSSIKKAIRNGILLVMKTQSC